MTTKFNKLFLTTLLFTIILSLSVFADPTYKDVSSTHWAYEHIMNVSNAGYMTGDTNGYFHPDAQIDKFQMSEILAAASGYNSINPTPEQQAYYDTCYKNNEALLNSYSQKFKTWNTNANMEIAYLLDKGILVPADLDQFVVIVNGNERYRAVSKEEACVYLVRLIGKENEALAAQSTSKFPDDDKITVSYKPYVYYLYDNGVINGDENGNFNPGTSVTKATFSAMLDKSLKLKETTQSDPTLSTISGTISVVYSSGDVIQVTNASHGNAEEMFKVNADTVVFIDSVQKTTSDLKAGMHFVATTNDDTIINITASTPTSSTQNTSTSTTTQTSNETTPTQTTPTQSNNITVDGKITSTSSNNNLNTVTVDVKTLNSSGSISTISTTYPLANDVKIKRDDAYISFNEIKPNDIATLQINNGVVTSIQLQEANKTITNGTIINKSLSETTGLPNITVQDTTGTSYTFTIEPTSLMTRNGYPITNWQELKVGDTVNLTSEYGTIKTIDASGIITTVTGVIETINITNNSTIISVKLSDGTSEEYFIPSGMIDVYSLKVGTQVRILLDSKEVQSISIIEQASSNSITGKVSSVSGNKITLTPNNSPTPTTVYTDSYTTFIDSRTGQQVDQSQVTVNSNLHVIYSQSNPSYAQTITILY